MINSSVVPDTCPLGARLIDTRDMIANNSPWLGVRGLLFALAAFLMIGGTATAQSLSLLTPSIANINGALTARYGVEVETLPAIKGELEDGLVLKLKCRADLYETMDYWMDSHLSTADFESTLSYDALTKEFLMTLPGKEKPLKDTDLPALLKKGWGTIESVLGPWNMLVRDEQYSLHIETSLNEADAPEGLTKIIYFWSWDSGSNAIFRLNFTY